MDAAQRGILGRGNTRPGTAGRQAVDRFLYLRRKRQGRPGETAREALGHDRPAVRANRAISVFVDRPDPWMVLAAPTPNETRRAARYDALVGQLASGRLSPAAFNRRISGWRPIRGERFLSDPDRVLAEIERRRASDEELFYYESGRTA